MAMMAALGDAGGGAASAGAGVAESVVSAGIKLNGDEVVTVNPHLLRLVAEDPERVSLVIRNDDCLSRDVIGHKYFIEGVDLGFVFARAYGFAYSADDPTHLPKLYQLIQLVRGWETVSDLPFKIPQDAYSFVSTSLAHAFFGPLSFSVVPAEISVEFVAGSDSKIRVVTRAFTLTNIVSQQTIFLNVKISYELKYDAKISAYKISSEGFRIEGPEESVALVREMLRGGLSADALTALRQYVYTDAGARALENLAFINVADSLKKNFEVLVGDVLWSVVSDVDGGGASAGLVLASINFSSDRDVFFKKVRTFRCEIQDIIFQFKYDHRDGYEQAALLACKDNIVLKFRSLIAEIDAQAFLSVPAKRDLKFELRFIELLAFSSDDAKAISDFFIQEMQLYHDDSNYVLKVFNCYLKQYNNESTSLSRLMRQYVNIRWHYALLGQFFIDDSDGSKIQAFFVDAINGASDRNAVLEIIKFYKGEKIRVGSIIQQASDEVHEAIQDVAMRKIYDFYLDNTYGSMRSSLSIDAIAQAFRDYTSSCNHLGTPEYEVLSLSTKECKDFYHDAILARAEEVVLKSDAALAIQNATTFAELKIAIQNYKRQYTTPNSIVFKILYQRGMLVAHSNVLAISIRMFCFNYLNNPLNNVVSFYDEYAGACRVGGFLHRDMVLNEQGSHQQALIFDSLAEMVFAPMIETVKAAMTANALKDVIISYERQCADDKSITATILNREGMQHYHSIFFDAVAKQMKKICLDYLANPDLSLNDVVLFLNDYLSACREGGFLHNVVSQPGVSRHYHDILACVAHKICDSDAIVPSIKGASTLESLRLAVGAYDGILYKEEMQKHYHSIYVNVIAKQMKKICLDYLAHPLSLSSVALFLNDYLSACREGGFLHQIISSKAASADYHSVLACIAQKVYDSDIVQSIQNASTPELLSLAFEEYKRQYNNPRSSFNAILSQAEMLSCHERVLSLAKQRFKFIASDDYKVSPSDVKNAYCAAFLAGRATLLNYIKDYQKLGSIMSSPEALSSHNHILLAALSVDGVCDFTSVYRFFSNYLPSSLDASNIRVFSDLYRFYMNESKKSGSLIYGYARRERGSILRDEHGCLIARFQILANAFHNQCQALFDAQSFAEAAIVFSKYMSLRDVPNSVLKDLAPMRSFEALAQRFYNQHKLAIRNAKTAEEASNAFARYTSAWLVPGSIVQRFIPRDSSYHKSMIDLVKRRIDTLSGSDLGFFDAESRQSFEQVQANAVRCGYKSRSAYNTAYIVLQGFAGAVRGAFSAVVGAVQWLFGCGAQASSAPVAPSVQSAVPVVPDFNRDVPVAAGSIRPVVRSYSEIGTPTLFRTQAYGTPEADRLLADVRAYRRTVLARLSPCDSTPRAAGVYWAEGIFERSQCSPKYRRAQSTVGGRGLAVGLPPLFPTPFAVAAGGVGSAAGVGLAVGSAEVSSDGVGRGSSS